MLKSKIEFKDLSDCVRKYESEVRNSSFVGDTNEKFIKRYKALRREKLVLIIPPPFVEKYQKEMLDKAIDIITADATMSENIDVYTVGYVTEKEYNEFDELLRKKGMSVSFFDLPKMQGTMQFEMLFETDDSEQPNHDLDPAFFDYLALSNDSSDIKNGFFYALLLMEIYSHENPTEEEFYKICREKYGRDQSDVKRAIKYLRQHDKIMPPQTGAVLKLTNNESKNIEISIKDSRAEELKFKESLKNVAEKYGIHDYLPLYDQLKKKYLTKYNLISSSDEFSTESERKSEEDISAWQELLGLQDSRKIQDILNDIKEVCNSSDYMDQYALLHSFLDLFRSDKYEGYIGRKKQYIYLDTPFVVNFVCAKSSFQDDYNLNWENVEFNSVIELSECCVGLKDKIKIDFMIPYDYMHETIGELKKALQFNWFNQFENLPIPVVTANAFYNYYQEVKACKILQNEPVEDFTFDVFANEIGFPELNVESVKFTQKNIAYLKYYLEQLGCCTLNKVEVDYSLFDDIKKDYERYLTYRHKEKSELAVKADVRQAMYVTDNAKSSDYEDEYYLVSWDNTLYELRDVTKEAYNIVGRTYSIFKPRALAEKLAFRNFKINKECVSDEVFAYANNSYNLNDKIRSLYDNILNPYFASFSKSNSKLVLAVLNLQKASMEGDVDNAQGEEKTALETIFLNIISELPKYNCSTQNLKDYLNEENNNKEIIPLFDKAFEEYKKGLKVNIAKEICELVKKYASGTDREIVL